MSLEKQLQDNPFLYCTRYLIQHPEFLGKHRNSIATVLQLHAGLGLGYFIPLYDQFRCGKLKIDEQLLLRMLKSNDNEFAFLILVNLGNRFLSLKTFRNAYERVKRVKQWDRKHTIGIAAALTSYCCWNPGRAKQFVKEIQCFGQSHDRDLRWMMLLPRVFVADIDNQFVSDLLLRLKGRRFEDRSPAINVLREITRRSGARKRFVARLDARDRKYLTGLPRKARLFGYSEKSLVEMVNSLNLKG